MEAVLLKSSSKKDIGLLVNLAKKIGVDVKKIPSNEVKIDKNSEEYELKVEQNLGKLMEISKNSPLVSREKVFKALRNGSTL
jgi:HD superfamily phosphohydrolase